MIDARLAFEPTDPAIWSATIDGGRRWRLCEIKDGGFVGAGVNAAILGLTGELWSRYGSPLFVGTVLRNWEDQAAAHEADPNNAVPAGESMHESGNAIDFDLDALTCTYGEFADACARWGLTGISNERWHKQNLGFWPRLYAARPARETAMAMRLDLGLSDGQTYEGRPNYGTDEVAALQAQIWRVYGPGCGAVDGFHGNNTKAALRALGLREDVGYRDLWKFKSVA